jgi:non-homologous end joining protein Ku
MLDNLGIHSRISQGCLSETSKKGFYNIDSFKKLWQEQLDNAVTEKLKGRTPAGGSETKGASSSNFADLINKNKLR